MRNFFTLASVFFLFATHIFSCKKSSEKNGDLSVQPYPPIAEQRAAIASKLVVSPVHILDSLQIIQDLEYLASDVCEGRKPGTTGHSLAKEHILNRMRSNGVDSFGSSLEEFFTGFDITGTTTGKNIIGLVKGKEFPDKYIIISAHYDHLGKAPNGDVYNGADDNASGISCLLDLSRYFKQNPFSYSLVFAAFDREESGLEGAYNFVHQMGVLIGTNNIKFNLNLDMIARSDSNEIFFCGIRHYRPYKFLVDQTQYKTNIKLLMGHDGGSSGNDWTYSGDHSAFHQKNIPFLYIGVEDHSDYHATTDDVTKINYSRFIETCNMIASVILILKIQ